MLKPPVPVKMICKSHPICAFFPFDFSFAPSELESEELSSLHSIPLCTQSSFRFSISSFISTLNCRHSWKCDIREFGSVWLHVTLEEFTVDLDWTDWDFWVVHRSMDVSWIPGASGWSLHFSGAVDSKKAIIDLAASSPIFFSSSAFVTHPRASFSSLPTLFDMRMYNWDLRHSSPDAIHCSNISCSWVESPKLFRRACIGGRAILWHTCTHLHANVSTDCVVGVHHTCKNSSI